MRRFSTGKESDFTKPCKLTRQKRWPETPEEFVRLEHKAFNNIKKEIKTMEVEYYYYKYQNMRR